MLWLQNEVELSAKPRGFHLVTREIARQLPEIASIAVGQAHFFILHTSAGLTVNENASPDVLHDLNQDFDRLVPEHADYYRHTEEGPDDMPAHTKSTLAGASVIVPIRQGALWLGTWQGIYLGEFRERAGRRRIAVTLQGQTTDDATIS